MVVWLEEHLAAELKSFSYPQMFSRSTWVTTKTGQSKTQSSSSWCLMSHYIKGSVLHQQHFGCTVSASWSMNEGTELWSRIQGFIQYLWQITGDANVKIGRLLDEVFYLYIKQYTVIVLDWTWRLYACVCLWAYVILAQLPLLLLLHIASFLS